MARVRAIRGPRDSGHRVLTFPSVRVSSTGIIATANTIRNLSTHADFAAAVANTKTPRTDL